MRALNNARDRLISIGLSSCLLLSNLSSVHLIAHPIILLFAMASERMLASLPLSE